MLISYRPKSIPGGLWLASEQSTQSPFIDAVIRRPGQVFLNTTTFYGIAVRSEDLPPSRSVLVQNFEQHIVSFMPPQYYGVSLAGIIREIAAKEESE